MIVYLFKILGALAAIILLSSAGCEDPLATRCSGPLHDHTRIVSVTGLRDTMSVGDTITVEISMDWINPATENGGSYDLRELDDPTDHGVHMFSSNAPIGGRGDRPLPPAPGSQIRSFANDDIVPLYGNWSIRSGQATALGDSTSTQWRAGLQLVFNTPGRNLVCFFNTRTSEVHGEADGVVYTNGITTDGCSERVVTRQVLQGYTFNQDMINRAELISDIKIRTNLAGLQDTEAGFYVLVL